MDNLENHKTGGKAKSSDSADKYLRSGVSEKEAYNKISDRTNDKDKLEKIFGEFKSKRDYIKKVARKFTMSQLSKLSGLAPINYDEFERVAKKTYMKAMKKHNLPIEAFTMFLDMLVVKKAQEQGISFSDSKMAKMLGFTDLLKAGKLNVDLSDAKTIAQIKDLHAQTRQLYERSVLDSSSYTYIPTTIASSKPIRDRFIFTGDKPKNFYNHVHPVIAALFLNKFPGLEKLMLQSNFGYIIECLEKGFPIQTEPDFELYKNLVLDISGVKSSKNAAVDYLNRFELQVILWNEVLCFRAGKPYNGRLDKFLAAIEKYRDNVYDAPMIAFVKDNGTIARRLFNAFSYRPIQVKVSPYAPAANFSPALAPTTTPMTSGPAIGISNITSIPVLNIKIVGATDITVSLKGYEWFLNNGMMIQLNQEVIKCKNVDDIFVLNTDRRESIPVTNQIPFSYGKVPVLQYSSGWETMNYGTLTNHLVLDDTVGIPATTNPTVVKYDFRCQSIIIHHFTTNQGNRYIFGSSVIFCLGVAPFGGLRTNKSNIYNPLGPITTQFNESNDYNAAGIRDLSKETSLFPHNVIGVDATAANHNSGSTTITSTTLNVKVSNASSLIIYEYKNA